MSLLDAANEVARGRRRSKPCAVTELLESLDESTRREVEALLASKYDAGVIEETLAMQGILPPSGELVPRQTIGRHRRGTCCRVAQ